MKASVFFKSKALLLAVAALGLASWTAVAQAPSDVRVALIFGNAAYPGNMALANPANDAKDMAKTLREMGFGVIEVIDASKEQMTAAIERANKNLQGKQGIGMLFYAGHGLQLDWRNYMVPVDAKLASASDVPKQTVDIETVMQAFKSAGNRMNIVVLDACRDNPFADGKTSSGKGLAPLDAPTGTFLAYATAPGNVAADGAAGSKNGLYTGFLLQELQKPSANIENVFKRVRFAVRKASNGSQIPWETTSLEDDFVFNSGIKKVVKLSDDAKEKQFELEKAEWDKIKDSKTAEPFYAFIQKYPTGMLAASAQGAIDRFAAVKVQAYKTKEGEVVQASATERYGVGDDVQYQRYDGYSKQPTITPRTRVLRVEDGKVYLAGGGVHTTNGESIVEGGTRHSYDPPVPRIPPDGFAVGRKWESRSRFTLGSGPSEGQVGWIETTSKVVAYEDVTVPAGTFKAYKIRTEAMNRWGYRSLSHVWIAPSVSPYTLKMTFEGRGRSGNPDLWHQEATKIDRARGS